MKADNIENIVKYLAGQGIDVIYAKGEPGVFNRVIEFTIEENTYFIEWWVNQSYLKFKNEFSSPCLPFKYIMVNPFTPTETHGYHLCFYDVKKPGEGQFMYFEVPFGAFRIPFNLK